MPTFLQRSDRFGFAMTVLIALVVWVLHVAGAFQTTDDWLIDRWQRSGSWPSGEEILLVETPSDYFHEASPVQIETLVETLGVLGARTVAVAQAIPSGELSERLSGKNGVVFQNAGDEIGVNSLPGKGQLIYRRFLWSSQEDTLEQSIARHSLAKRDSGGLRNPRAHAKIRYVGQLPRVSSDRVLGHELVPEMVAGRTVILGESVEDRGRVFHTPISINQSIDELELRGQIVRCLMSGDWISRVAYPVSAMMILFASAIAVQMFRNLYPQWWSLGIVVFVAASMGLGCFAVETLSIELPVTALFVTLLVAHFLVTRQRFDVLRSALDRRFSEANSNAVRVDSNSVHRDAPSDVWQQAAQAWYDLFAPTRIALLELDAGDTYLAVRALAGADESDIGERRRDVTRMPYRDAVDLKMATTLTQKIFFTASAAADAISAGGEIDRTQYAVPLIASKTIGVVVIEIETSRLAGWDAFEEQAMDFASELATYLANHREQSQDSSFRGSSISRAASLPEQWMAASIVASNSVAKSADEMWMRAFETATNPIAICDPFGRVVQANSQMITDLQQCGQSLTEFDAIEWLQDITGRSRQDCGDLLRRIVLQQRGEKLFCKTSQGESLAPILVIKPLAREGEEQVGLSARAMSIELISPSLFTNAANWERAFSKHQRQEIERRATKCLAATGSDLKKKNREIHKGDSVSEEGLPKEWSSVLDDIGQLVALCREQEGSLSDSPDCSAPLPMEEIVSEAIDDCRHSADAKGLGLAVDRESSLPLGFVNPFYMSELFRTLTECVSADAVAGETLGLSIHYQGGFIVCDFSPSGMDPIDSMTDPEGDPNGKQPKGRGIESLPAEVADEFHRVKGQVDAWGGMLRITCSDDFRIAVRIGFKAVESALGNGDHFAVSRGKDAGGGGEVPQ